jgi:alanine racemase
MAGLTAPALAEVTASKTNPSYPRSIGDRIDPWIEVYPDAFKHNLRYIGKRTGRRVIAVVKCNGYGLDHRVVGPLLDPLPEVAALAVVTEEEAITLRDSGVRKPILLMDDFVESAADELAARNITIGVFTAGADKRLTALAKRAGRPIDIHLYLDTGFHRMGMDWRHAESWAANLAENPSVRITGTFTELCEDFSFDKEQITRFRTFTSKLAARGVKLGPLHAIASKGIANHPEAAFDLVRPGNMIYGILPDDSKQTDFDIQVAYRLKARIIRIVHLEAGESAGYGRAFMAAKPTEVAVIKCGRTDGYIYRTGGKGTHVLIHSKLYPVVGRVSASHCLADLGLGHNVAVRDVATLLGPEPGVRPYELADTLGLSRYESFNMSARLPRYVVTSTA